MLQMCIKMMGGFILVCGMSFALIVLSVLIIVIMMKLMSSYMYNDFSTYAKRAGRGYTVFHITSLILLSNGPSVMFFLFLSRIFNSIHLTVVSHMVRRLANILVGSEISTYASIGKGLQVFHGRGIVIGDGAVLGEGVWLFQNVCIGKNYDGSPKIEDGVIVFQGAVICGDITVGRNSVISPNTIVSKDVPANSMVFGQNGLVIKPRVINNTLN